MLIASFTAFDWYAAAHHGILGTTKPTRYVVMEGELSLEPVCELVLSLFLLTDEHCMMCVIFERCSSPLLTNSLVCRPDDLQSSTNALCHGYQRCNRAVSIPAPV